jgi:hypothetical protein
VRDETGKKAETEEYLHPSDVRERDVDLLLLEELHVKTYRGSSPPKKDFEVIADSLPSWRVIHCVLDVFRKQVFHLTR